MSALISLSWNNPSTIEIKLHGVNWTKHSKYIITNCHVSTRRHSNSLFYANCTGVVPRTCRVNRMESVHWWIQGEGLPFRLSCRCKNSSIRSSPHCVNSHCNIYSWIQLHSTSQSEWRSRQDRSQLGRIGVKANSVLRNCIWIIMIIVCTWESELSYNNIIIHTGDADFKGLATRVCNLLIGHIRAGSDMANILPRIW